MAKKSTKQTTSRSNPESLGKEATAKKSAKRSMADAVGEAKAEPSPAPSAPSREVLDIPDDAFADGKCIDVAAVQEEAWFQDYDGGPRTDAYRIGRGIHALGWLCLSSQLLRLKLRHGPRGWRRRSVPAVKAATYEKRAQKFEERVALVDRSITDLAAFLGDVAASTLAADAFRDVRPWIRRHLQVVDDAEYESGGLIFPEKLSGDLGDAFVFEYPFHVRFGERIYSCEGLQKAFCERLSEDLRTALQLGIEVDALLRRPVEAHGDLHRLLGLIPNAELPTGPVGSVAELCRQVPISGESLDGIEELLHGPRDVGVVDAIDFEIRKALRAMPASPKPKEGGTSNPNAARPTGPTSTGGGKTQNKGSTDNRPVPGYLAAR